MSEWIPVVGDFAIAMAKLLVPALVSIITFYIAKKWKVNIEQDHESMLQWFLHQAINRAEQEFKVGEIGKDDRMKIAVKHALSLIGNSGLPKKLLARGEDRIKELIEAELGQINSQ